VFYELSREVWGDNIQGAIDYAEPLPTEGDEALIDDTNYPMFATAEKAAEQRCSRGLQHLSFGLGFQIYKLFVVGAPPTAALARANASIEETALHRVARQSERRPEVLARGLIPAAAKLELAERRRVERICSEAIAVGNGADRFEPTLRSLALRDRNGAVERDDRRRAYCHQRVVERNDRSPVRILRAQSACMNRRDCGFDVILGEFGARSGKFQKFQSFTDELLIPLRSILIR